VHIDAADLPIGTVAKVRITDSKPNSLAGTLAISHI
jgi:hypothetical protein